MGDLKEELKSRLIGLDEVLDDGSIQKGKKIEKISIKVTPLPIKSQIEKDIEETVKAKEKAFNEMTDEEKYESLYGKKRKK